MSARVAIPSTAFVRPPRVRKNGRKDVKKPCPFRNSLQNMRIVAAISRGAETSSQIAAAARCKLEQVVPRLARLAGRTPALVERSGLVGRHVRWKITNAGKRAILSAVPLQMKRKSAS